MSTTRAATSVLMLAWLAMAAQDSVVAQPREEWQQEELPTGPPARRSPKSTMHEFHHGGLTRRYGLHVPRAVIRGNERVPLVVVLHGATGDADRIERYLGFNEVAEAERFIVAYPEGIKGGWDDGRSDALRWRRQPQPADDVGFLDALTEHLIETLRIDPERVYLTGISNGGFMTTRMACDRPERFAAFAPMLSSMPADLAKRCTPSRPMPMLMLAATQDSLIPWRGVEKDGHSLLPVLDHARFWARHNGCASSSEQRLNDVDPKDGSTLILAEWEGCRPSGAVEFYGIDGGGHQTPSMRRTASDFLIGMFLGSRNRDMETAEVVWRFLRRFRLPRGG